MKENLKPAIRKLDFIFYRMDRCQNCGTENLEIYDYFNNPMGYKSIVDLYMSGSLMPKAIINKRDFYTIRCKKCGKTYPIIWSYGFPLPDFSPRHISRFLYAFKTCK